MPDLVKRRNLRRSDVATFSNRHTYEQLEEIALRQKALPLDVSGDDSIDCFCGD